MKNHPGKVSRLGRETDRETREFLVDVQPVSLPENWSVGQRAEVFIETEREKDAILLPSGFINWKDGRAGVFIHSGGKARWREISPGLRGEDRISVLAGLDVGDEVLRLQENQTSPLVDGRRITVR